MKITFKTIFVFFITLFLIAFIPNVIVRVFFKDLMHENFSYNVFFFLMLVSSTIALLVYAFVMHILVVRRVKNVSNATCLVAKGNTDVHIIEQGNDEISVLIRNFNKMVAELQSNQYLNKEFARNYSHELKTPLSTIKGYAELIEMGNLSTAEIKEYSAIIVKESQRLANMSSVMMQISLLDSTTIIAKDDHFNVGEQIRNLIALMQVTWEAKKIIFDLELDDVKITSNKALLFHVWENIVSNAINFSPIGGQIDIVVKEVNNNLKVMIKDHGVGISKEDINNIFNLFFISGQNKSGKSNGIGLTLAKKAVERLGGTISVTSETAEPTTFIVTLPLA